MKTAKFNVPFFFGKAEMTPHCGHKTSHDREFGKRNRGAQLACQKCRQGFAVPSSESGHASVSTASVKTMKVDSFFGFGGREITAVQCPYCNEQNEHSPGFAKAHAGQEARCDHCYDRYRIPGRAASANTSPKPSRQTQPQRQNGQPSAQQRLAWQAEQRQRQQQEDAARREWEYNMDIERQNRGQL